MKGKNRPKAEKDMIYQYLTLVLPHFCEPFQCECKFKTSRHTDETQAKRCLIPWGVFVLWLKLLVAVLPVWTPRVFVMDKVAIGVQSPFSSFGLTGSSLSRSVRWSKQQWDMFRSDCVLVPSECHSIPIYLPSTLPNLSKTQYRCNALRPAQTLMF